MSIFSRIFGGDDDSHDAVTERILASSGSTPEAVAKAAPVPGPGPISLLSSPFLRGMDDGWNGGKSLHKPYEKSAWVQRAIKHVSDPIAGVPLRFATMTADGLKAFINPALAAWWEWPALGPAGRMSRAAVVEASVAWLKLRGEFFWLLGEDWGLPRPSRSAPLSPFVIARPDAMKHVLSPDGGRLLGWYFRDANGTDHELLPESVIHCKLWNPYDPVRGCPEYASAATAAEADVYAAEFGRNLMAGNGDRGPIISSESPLSPDQVAQVDAQLRARARAAQQGVRKTTFLPADVTIQDPAISQVDAEFIASRVENRKEIYMAFGVPSSFAEQMHRATTAHESDRYILIEDTCMPTAARMAGPIAMLAMRFLGIDPTSAGALHAYFDFAQHSVMLEARTERIEAAQRLWQMGMPFSQVNAFLNLQAPAFKGDDVSYLPLAIQTAAEAQAALPAPADAKKPAVGDDDPPESADDPTQLMIRALSAPVPTFLEGILSLPVVEAEIVPPAPLDGPAVPPVPEVRATPEPGTDEAARDQAWARLAKMRRPAEKLMAKAVGRVIFHARGQVLRNIEAKGKKSAPVPVTKDDDDKKDTPPPAHPGNATELMFDGGQFATDMVAAVGKIARHAIQQAGDELRDEVSIDDSWVAPASTVLNALRDREPLIRDASQEVFDEIKSTLEAGFQNGDTTDELAGRVRQAFNGISDDHAENIAVTETGAAYEAGRSASAQGAGLRTKEWLSSRDARVRPDHREADGQVVKADGLFSVGSEQTPYPCGPGLSAKQACRCRCIALYRSSN